MSQVKVEQDHDDPPEARATNAGDRTTRAEDVVIVVRTPRARWRRWDVTVKADGKRSSRPDRLAGEAGRQDRGLRPARTSRSLVDASVVGDKGQSSRWQRDRARRRR